MVGGQSKLFAMEKRKEQHQSLMCNIIMFAYLFITLYASEQGYVISLGVCVCVRVRACACGVVWCVCVCVCVSKKVDLANCISDLLSKKVDLANCISDLQCAEGDSSQFGCLSVNI